MSRFLTDVADLAGYDDPNGLDTLHIAREYASPAYIHTRLLSVIVGGFPTVALDHGASSFATALRIRERYAKYPNILGLSLVHHNLRGPRHL